jgi:ATP phosphoribosyltransferase regulatory subunit
MKLTEIPKGFKTLLPEESKRLKEAAGKFEKVLNSWGYDPLSLPTVEFLLPFKAVDDSLEELSFKIVDRYTGRLMAVRPDFTPQVARVVASSFKNEEPPFRFYYQGKVFRDTDGDREINQFGFELIGVPQVEADAEVVAVMVNCLKELGLRSFQIDVGHAKFLKGALSEMGLKGEEREQVLKLLSHKDLSGLALFVEEKRELKEKLLPLVELYGTEEVLDRAEQLFKNEESRKAVEELRQVFQILKSYGFAENVIFDLSEKKGMEYHTGITFEVLHPLYGFPLGRGGRYDTLLEKFGKKLAATGMAVNLDAVVELLEKKGLQRKREKKDFYLIDLKKELHLAYQLARELRDRGFSVARDIVKRDYEESVKVAFSKGYRFVVVLNRDEEPKNLLYTSPDRWRELKGELAEELSRAAIITGRKSANS